MLGAVFTFAPAALAAPCGDGSLTFSGGDGSAGSPYLISSQADLVALRGGYTTTPSYYSCAYRQTQNITLTGAWEHGIGFSTGAQFKPFNGTYDGGGYSLTNLTINASAVATANQSHELGFIGLSDSPSFVLRNLDLVSATITCGSETLDVALLVGKTSGTVERSSATGTVTCTAADSIARAGGLIGYTNGSVTNAWVSGTVTIPPSGVPPFIPGSAGGGIGQSDSSANVQNVLIRVTLVNPDGAIRAGVAWGWRAGTTSGSYAEDGLTGGGTPLVGAGTTTGIALKTAVQLQDITTYSGWSISAGRSTSTVWGIDPTINGGFPFLQALARAGGVSQGSAPAPILQQLPRLPDGSCAITNDAEFAFGTTVTGGWSPSWAWWPNGGTGGPICTRTLAYVGQGWAVNSTS